MKHFDGLYGDLNFNSQRDYIFLERIETRSVSFDWVIDTHIHPHLHQIFFIDSGIVDFTGPVEAERLKTPCILIIPPSTPHGLKYNQDIKGSILTISDTVIEEIFRNIPSILVNLECFHQLSFLNKKDYSYIKIKTVLENIHGELFGNETDRNYMLKSCFVQLFIYLLRSLHSNEKTVIKDTNITLQHFKKFKSLVRKNEVHVSIPSLAKEIGVSTVHLNRICKKVSGQTALLIVEEHKIEQAKNYLTHTSYSVSEIAYHLNFEYPNYFARLFRKISGMSPSQYRKEKRK